VPPRLPHPCSRPNWPIECVMATANPKILLETAELLALDKPAGLLAHAEQGAGSALQWARDRELAAGRDPEELLLVHRLDRDTSGILLMVRGAELAESINALFRERKVLKVYLAVTSPVPPLRWLRVEQLLKPQRLQHGEFMRVAPDGGLPASSEIEVLARGRRMGFVRVIPEQGRKHQVRVALASSGAPIVGDFLYGGDLVAKMAKRVMLHARTLEFRHPVTNEHLVLRAPVPADMVALLQEDACALPGDMDRRHRTTPQTGKVVKSSTTGLSADRSRAQAAAIELPRSLRASSRAAGGGRSGGSHRP
jgi:23S rRNA-/tRNA-specific pseudouridylate synthase